MKPFVLPIAFAWVVVSSLAACGGSEPTTIAGFVPTDVAVGDPSVSYANVEFTRDGQYMVWFEQLQDGTGRGTVWHCRVDPNTGTFIPADGKGFRAFDSTTAGRANPGMDALGPYYVGLDRFGQLVRVRPTSATSGNVDVLPTPADVTRRAIYPSDLPGQNRGFVLLIKNELVPGGPLTPGNNWFELQYVDLADPATINVVERQDKPASGGYPPMDVAFVRWFRGRAALTYGFADANGLVQVRELNLDSPAPQPVQVTNDVSTKIDPFPFTFNGQDIAIAGINTTVTSHVYTRPIGTTLFQVQEVIVPPASSLSNPMLAQSHERIVFNGVLYSAYQINEPGANFQDTAFSQTGEIWLTTVLQPVRSQWRVSAVNGLAKSEPEPYVGTSRVWIFYTALPQGADVLTAKWSLRRAETPLRR